MPEERCSGGRTQPVEAEGERSSARRRPVRRARPMIRGLFAAALLCASAGAIACPLCMGAFQQSKAQELVSAPHAVLAVPTADPSRFRVIEVVKGERPASGTVEGGYPRNGPALEAAGSTSGKALLLVRDDLLPTWTILGTIGADHLGWLRKLAAGKRAAEMSPEDWRARAALVLPYLESREPLAAEIAYGELAAAPYAALRTLKSRLAAPAVRRWVADPERVARQPLYLLLLGIAGDAQDAAGLEQRLEAAWTSSDATNVGPMIAADLELKGPARMAVGGRAVHARSASFDPRARGGAARALRAGQRERRHPARAGDPVVPTVHQGAQGNRRIRRAGSRGLAVLGRCARVRRAHEIRTFGSSTLPRSRSSRTCGRARMRDAASSCRIRASRGSGSTNPLAVTPCVPTQ